MAVLFTSGYTFKTGEDVSKDILPKKLGRAFGSASLTMATGFLLGNNSGGVGPAQEITLGTGLSFTGTTLNATGGGSSPLTTKGDLYGYDTAGNRVPIGVTNGMVLTVDSTAALGLKWAVPVTGSGTVNSGTATQVGYYATTSTAITGASNLLWDNTNIFLQVGGTASASASVGAVRMYGDTDATTYFNTRRASASNAGGGFFMSKARGTLAAPTAPNLLDDRLGTFGAGGYTGSVWNDTAASLFFLVAEPSGWTAANNGTKLVVSLTPNGTNARADKFTFHQDGGLYFGTGTTGPYLTGDTGQLWTLGNLGVGTATPAYTAFGRALTVQAATSGAYELASTRADADAVVIGSLSGNYRTNSASHQRFAEIQFASDGATANQRGGAIVFLTKANGSTTFSEKARFTAAGQLTLLGPLQIANAYVAGAVVATGTITIKDSTGTTYRVPVLV